MKDKTFFNKEITIEKITLAQLDRIGQMRNLGTSNKHHYMEELDSLVLIYLPEKIATKALEHKKKFDVTRKSPIDVMDEYYLFIKRLMEESNIAWGTRRIITGSLE